MTTKEKHDGKAKLYKEGKNESEPYVPKKKIRDFDENAGKGISIDHLF